jgi:S1-C subfamily serine protease
MQRIARVIGWAFLALLLLADGSAVHFIVESAVPEAWAADRGGPAGDRGWLIDAQTKPKKLPHTESNKQSVAGAPAGTGFRLFRTDLIVTTYHFLKRTKTIIVTLDEKMYPSTVMLANPMNDLAVLRAGLPDSTGSTSPTAGLVLGDSSAVKQGDRVWSLGYSLEGIVGKGPTFVEGTVNALSGPKNDLRFFQVPAQLQRGSTGSPLFDDRGRVIGVMVSTADVARMLRLTGAMPQNAAFAIKSSYVKALLQSHASKEWDVDHSAVDLPQRLITEMVEALKGSIVSIQVDVRSTR